MGEQHNQSHVWLGTVVCLGLLVHTVSPLAAQNLILLGTFLVTPVAGRQAFPLMAVSPSDG